MLLIRLLSRPENPDANEKKRIALSRLHPEYEARIKQTASPAIPLIQQRFSFILSTPFLSIASECHTTCSKKSSRIFHRQIFPIDTNVT